MYQILGTDADLKAHPPSGKLIDVGGYRLHLYCVGSGEPTVILMHGLGGNIYHWSQIQPAIAQFTTVCAYDRAGYGWSDAGPAPRTHVQNARELHQLLTAAAIPAPYVLVGHSWGATGVQVYADLYPKQIAGVLLVDGGEARVALEQCPTPRCMPNTARVGADVYLTLQPFFFRVGLVRLLGFPQAYGDQLKYLNAEQLASFNALYGQTKGADTNLAEWRDWETQAGNVGMPQSLGDVPLIAIFAEATFPDWAYDNEPAVWAARLQQQQNELLRLSTQSQLIVVQGADHASLLFHPDHSAYVVAAVQQLLSPHETP